MGQPIGSRYELEEQLGRGAFGSVWRGRVRETNEAVAVKVLLEELANDADVVTRFLRERTALVGLRHRSLVSIRDLVVEGDILALVMQLVEGPDLRAYLRSRGTLGQEEAAVLCADVAEALAVAHSAQIIHRDVKPANVLLKPEAGSFRPLLTDFGIARLADAPSVTRTSQVVGTPYYLAPEVIGGAKVTNAVDVYASGIMIYELLTGHPPFRGRDAMEVFQAHQTATPQRPPNVSDRLWSVITAALAKDPLQRPSASELATRLRGAVRVGHDGATVRLPVNPTDGTALLPAIAADLRSAPRSGSPSSSPSASPGSSPSSSPRSGAAQGAGSANAGPAHPSSAHPSSARPNVATPGANAPLAIPARPAPTPIASARAQAPTALQPPVQAASQRPRPVTPPPAQQPVRATPVTPQYPPTTPYQSRPSSGGAQSYPPAPAGPRPQQAPTQYQPRQQAYTAPRKQAPRYPQTYTPAPTQSTGLSCLSRLVILVVVLAVAVALGLAIGQEIANKHKNNNNNGSNTTGSSYGLSPYSAPAKLPSGPHPGSHRAAP